jgi:hypothetical protein
MFFAGLASAIAIKLSSSVDDVVWLAPFLTTNVSPNVRLQNALVYIGVCLIQTVVAMGIAYSGDSAVKMLTGDKPGSWSTGKILTVTAGTLLSIYTVKLAYEYMTESDEEDAESGESRDSTATSASAESSEMELGEVTKDRNSVEKGAAYECYEGIQQSDLPTLLTPKPGHIKGSEALLEKHSDDEDEEEKDQRRLPRKLSTGLAASRQISKRSAGDADPADESAEKKAQQTLFVIAFIGSIDDLTLFVPMLVGKGFNWLQLVTGAVVAASTIVLLCLFIGLCKPVADFLAKIPLALIVAVFASSLLIKGFTMV